LALMSAWTLDDGRARFVRHGHGPERAIQTGIGAVPVQRVKVRDRGASSTEARTSAILPRWGRRSPSLDALLPVLYLRGVSTGDFQEALSALLGRDAANLSPSVIGRLKGEWLERFPITPSQPAPPPDHPMRWYRCGWTGGGVGWCRVYLIGNCTSRVCCLAEARSEWATLCVRLGGRHLPASQDGEPDGMHAGDHWCNA
jgi:hypothetical protein